MFKMLVRLNFFAFSFLPLFFRKNTQINFFLQADYLVYSLEYSGPLILEAVGLVGRGLALEGNSS